MKKLLLLLMLVAATLTARAQVVYLTLDHDKFLVQKTNNDGKIYFAITGKVHNVRNLTLSDFCVQGSVQGSYTYFRTDVTVNEADTTFELKVPMNIPIGSTILIKFLSTSQSYTDNGIAPYIKMTCGFENKLVNKGVTWDGTNKKFTYAFQYQLKTDNVVTEDGTEYSYDGQLVPQPADPTAFENKLYITPINSNTAILGADSYEGSEYNNVSSSMSDVETELKDVTYDAKSQTFTWSSTAIAGTLALKYYTQYGYYDYLVKDEFRAYTVNLNLKNDASDKTKKQIHAEVKDVAGNIVKGGKLYYAIGYYNNESDDKRSTDAAKVAFYENNLEHYNRAAAIRTADELASLAAHASKTLTADEFSTNFYDSLYCLMRADDTGSKTYQSPIDSTGARSLKYIDESYYQSTALTEEGTADITCDLEHWKNRKINYTFKAVNPTDATEPLALEMDETSSLRVYFWYSPDGDVKNNGSLFYAYKTMDDQMTFDNLDKWTMELAKDTKITYGHDEYGGNTNYYFVTVQTKKNGTATKALDDWSGTNDIGTNYEYEFLYSVGSDKTSPKISDMNLLYTSSPESSDENNATYTYKIEASDLGVSKLYIASAIKMNNVVYPIAIYGYDVPGKVDRECSTTVNYTNYLGDDENGQLPSEGRVYDDLTGLLKKEWTNGPKFEEAKEGRVWTSNDNCHYYHVNGGTTVSQTIDADKLPAAESEYDPNTYTLQAIVRSAQGAKIELHLTHGTEKADKEVLGLGIGDNVHSTVDYNGCVDTIYTVLSDEDLKAMGFYEFEIPYGGWQKIETTVGSGAATADLGISITSDQDFDLADVVLLLNANKNTDTDFSHFLTTVPAIEGDTTGEYGYEDGEKLELTNYKKFSFFDRGPNINRIVEMARGTVMNYVQGADSRYMPFNVVLPKINSLDGKMIYRLFLKDGVPYYWYTSDNQNNTVECNYISYDREFTAGKPSTIALPFTVPTDVIFDWCTTGGYNAVKGKTSWTPSSADQGWGVLYKVADDGQVQLGQIWGFNSDGTIGGTLRTSGNSSSTFYGPVMYLKTVKSGKPFMGMKSDNNRALALCASNVTINPDPSPTNYSTEVPIVYCHEMSYIPVDADGSNASDYGVRQNESGYNFFVGSFRQIDDLAAARNTDSFTGMDGNNRTYHFYYWSAKNGVFKKVSEATDRKKVSCPPFRAFLAIGQKTDASSSAKESLGMRFVDFYGSGTTTGIKDITTSARQQADRNNVYSVTGMLVRRGTTSLAGLPNGLYIVNGKKVIVNRK
ncbi:MAG: hypothetical protein PUD58_08500 [Prevotella sp.]|uniref:hypothetical protein n=1 Tax=Prevotella sp. TaxID=59823 RepID=UPI002584601E|nr:hypothetical protein [Prevotella sp.]MDD6854321.1 hypothetical protein [Prevotella sp.]